MTELPPGKFKMGRGDFAVDVTLTRPFAIGRHEVTQQQWKKVMGTEPWTHSSAVVGIGADYPAVCISWDDAYAFCLKLTALEQKSSQISHEFVYRLPTEAEWEYACKAGTTTTYSFGDDPLLLGDYEWFKDNCSGHAEKVGTKNPNPWGLCDMQGNAWEWCSDWCLWPAMTLQGGTDPVGPASGAYRSLRGGTYCFPADLCKVTDRSMLPSYNLSLFGFRIVRSKVEIKDPTLKPAQPSLESASQFKLAPQLRFEDIEVTRDVVYGHRDGMALTYDIFHPKINPKGAGVLWMNTGLWVSMWVPAELIMGFFKPLLDAGYTVFCVRHCSSPKYVVPEMNADTHLALQHIYAHAEETKVDQDRLGVFGYSAGGHLSLLLGLTAEVPDSKGAKGKLLIRAIAAMYPPTTLQGVEDPEHPSRKEVPALRIDAAQALACSPILFVGSNSPPTLLVQGTHDTLVPIAYTEKFRDSLVKFGVPHEMIIIEGGGHGFDSVGNMRMFAGVIKWFDKYLAMNKPIAAIHRKFEAGLFGLLLVQSYFFDYARPIVNALAPPAPRGLPGYGDWLHALAPIFLAFILFKFFMRALEHGAKISITLVVVLLCMMSMGQGVHLSADSVDGRMQMRHAGPVDVAPADNPALQQLDESVRELFELVYIYDEVIGHWIWYAALYMLLLYYVIHCIQPTASPKPSLRTKVLAGFFTVPLGIFWFYGGVEAGVWQGTILLAFSFLLIMAFSFFSSSKLDLNGYCLVASFLLAAIFMAAWGAYFNDMPGVWEVWLRHFPAK